MITRIIVFLLLLFTCNLRLYSQNVNNSISISMMSYSQGWSGGYYENATFSISNSSYCNLLMVSLKIYNYNNNSEIYYEDYTNSYLNAGSGYAFSYYNNTGSSIIKDNALIIELQYLNMTDGGEVMTKKVIKKASTVGSNIVLPDLDEYLGTSGTCGYNLTWSYDSSTSTLTISGSGSMDDYDANSGPWSKYSFTNLVIGSGVYSIGKYAFSHSSSLRNLTIENGLSIIGERAFGYCKNLKKVVIPNSVTRIDWAAFESCSYLTSISIGNGIKKIDGGAFMSCGENAYINGTRGIKEFYCMAESAPYAHAGAFTSSYIENATLYVPANAVDNYLNATTWKNFGSIVATEVTGINENINFKSNKKTYSINGQELVTPQTGINIIRMSEGTTKKVVVK